MTQRGRNSGPEVVPSGGTQLPQASKHPRQFSTKSRAKSTASFKGIRRVLNHDTGGSSSGGGATASDGRDGHPPRPARVKSSDSIYRKRAISGLNMTALGRVRSNPGGHSHSRSHSHTASTGGGSSGLFGLGSPGLKPRRSKSTHSVLHYGERDDLYKNIDDTLTSEEVEDFTDEEVDNESNNGRSGSPVSHHESVSRRPEFTLGNDHELSKSAGTDSDSDMAGGDAKLRDNNHAATRSGPTLSRKDSNDHIENGYLSKVTSETKLDEDSHELTRQLRKQNSFQQENVDGSGQEQEQEQENDDVIDNAGKSFEKLEPIDAMEGSKKSLPISNPNPQVSPELQHLEPGSLNGQYIPNMILSQSTGMERAFEQPPSIQNSLAVGLREKKPVNNGQSNNNNYFNGGQMGVTTDENTTSQTIELRESNITEAREEEEKEEPSFGNNTTVNAQSTKRSSFSNSYSSLTNNLQRGNAAASLAAVASSLNSSGNKPYQINSDTTSKKEITNTEGNGKSSSSYINNIFNRRPASKGQTSIRQDSRSARRNNAAPSLLSQLSNGNNAVNKNENNEATMAMKNNETMNNFSQFLKTEASSGGDSRTQRKLWLQRESSIIDINLQNDDSVDSIFMATNVDIKREFERITHEYTNARRFYNPVDAALTRFEKNRDMITSTGKTSSKTNIRTHNDNNVGNNLNGSIPTSEHDSIFVSYGGNKTNSASGKNAGIKDRMDDFLASNPNSKLQRTLASIWKQESINYNNEVNPLMKVTNNNVANTNTNITNNTNPSIRQAYHNYNGPYQSVMSAARHSLRNAVGSNPNLHHQQRTINSLQPSTRAVNRRLESSHQRI